MRKRDESEANIPSPENLNQENDENNDTQNYGQTEN